MSAHTPTEETLLRQMLIKLARLPEAQLLIVNEFLNDLQQATASGQPRRSAAELREEAKRRAVELSRLSHEELVARFNAATERIRAQAIAKGVAIEGDWEGD
jgi:hypothetical protein